MNKEISGVRYSDLPFKGSRDYLHGTDTYEWIRSLAVEAGLDLSKTSLQLSFHRLFRSQLVLNGSGVDITGSPSVQAVLRGECGRLRWDFYESGLEVDRRVTYNEESVGEKCAIEGQQIEYLGGVDALPIEILVAMTKALHSSIFEDPRVKWVFARLELPRFLESGDLKGLHIKINYLVSKRFSKSEIKSDSGLNGFIYFSALG